MIRLLIRLLALKMIFPLAIAAAACTTSCGDMEVPYPFGLLQDEPGCYFNESYSVNCTRDSTHTIPYLSDTNIVISSISVVEHELRVLTYVARDCYNASGENTENNDPWLAVVMFPISNTKNKFIAIGCDTSAVVFNVSDFDYGDDYKTGCLTTCTDFSSVAKAKGSCSGIGCCFSPIPSNAYSFQIDVSSYNNHVDVKAFNNCSYAFVVANDTFTFSAEYLSNFNNETVQTVLDWSVGDGTCKEAKTNETSYMCKGNSSCFDAENGTGYRCKCLGGYNGNPYLSGDEGCQDEPGCYFNESYSVNCTRDSTHTIPYLSDTNIVISSISVVEHELRVLTYVARDCYNASGENTENNDPSLEVLTFPISNTKNKFIAIGCDTYAVVSNASDFDYGDYYQTGCLTTCADFSSVVNANGSCSGIGCCSSPIPKNAYSFEITVFSYNNHSRVKGFNKCSYAFVVANDTLNFYAEYLSDFNNETVQTVLDWSAGDGTCEEAKMNETSYMCKGNSTCFDAENGAGYRCKCLGGYDGNPYLSGDKGCQDINECNTTISPCVENANCKNTNGSFLCLCPKGQDGDGKKTGSQCTPTSSSTGGKKSIALAVGITIPSILLLCSWVYWGLRQRKILIQREKFFEQNGGLMLQNFLAKHKGSMETTTIFTDGQLKKATNNYDESTILGQGGHGIVYKGELNNKIVAIKKSKFLDQTQVKEFINEVVILTQINHKNVVKLIGCCLEKEVPLLVYEFITNGTLFDHIHKAGHHTHMSWRSRLRIAAETAGALSYLHSEATTQIIHGDIKTANILLDDNFTAKVSDFGASRLVAVDQTQVSMLIQGTLGYLDPEYLNGMELTDKSDVYSFGVVLAELLTGMKALSFTRPEKQKSLSMYFVSKYKEGNLLEIIDARILQDEFVEEIIEVAKLTTRCLQMSGVERPFMKEVYMELEGFIRATERHPWVENSHDESEYLLTNKVKEKGEITTSNSMAYDSIKNQVVFQIESGR